MFNLYYHPIYTSGIDEKSNFPRDRYQLIKNELKPYLEKHSIKIKESPIVDELIVKKIHDSHYVNRFLNQELDDKEIRRIGLKPWKTDIIERTLRITGGSIAAMKDAIVTGGLSGNMAGGTHHAHRNYGSGFCVFNDIAICAKIALEDLKIKRVLIIDLDVHQGDGTAEILKNEERAFTVSMHCSANFPFQKAKSNLDISIPKNTEDSQYLEVLSNTIESLEKKPSDLILFQAGVDILLNDRYGNLKLTREGVKKRNTMIFEFAKKRNNPVCIFMGGGYSNPIHDTVKSFKDLFTSAASYHKNFISNNA